MCAPRRGDERRDGRARLAGYGELKETEIQTGASAREADAGTDAHAVELALFGTERVSSVDFGEESEQVVETVDEADAAQHHRAGTDERDVAREGEAHGAEPRGLAEGDGA